MLPSPSQISPRRHLVVPSRCMGSAPDTRTASGGSSASALRPPTPERSEYRRVRATDLRRLIAGAVAGDKGAFAEVYAQYYARICGRLAKSLRDEHEVEDVAQSVFTRAWVALSEGRYDGQPFEAWLFTIAGNQLIDHVRKHGRSTVVDPDDVRALSETRWHVIDAPNHGWIESPRLRHNVGMLTPFQRQILGLTFLADMNTEVIAQVLGRSPGSIRTAKHDALKAL